MPIIPVHETELRFWDEAAKKNPYHAVCESVQKLDEFKRKKESILFHSKVDYQSKDLLDLCCGLGRLAFFIDKNVRSYVGVDWSKEMLEQAKQIHKDKTNVSFVKNNGVDLKGLENESFDIVVCELAFQHMKKKSTQHYINEAYRVLRFNGVFIAQIPKTLYFDGYREYRGRGFSANEINGLFWRFSKLDYVTHPHGYAYFVVKAEKSQ